MNADVLGWGVLPGFQGTCWDQQMMTVEPMVDAEPTEAQLGGVPNVFINDGKASGLQGQTSF